ncbi:YbjN domain-containing protein [Xylanimonas ulmi]|uniref:Putative sensory transduction regulator n=1 Tax=Xylanimonas ulmi TaxID=228973 RepID=A0A4Q7M5L8_9MICO|nr:YbjN domain-containing protein [Xylanibacterium ulmi]RZS61329.1 putative sensory transduction regulator [Xylanibacterium ulmi]
MRFFGSRRDGGSADRPTGRDEGRTPVRRHDDADEASDLDEQELRERVESVLLRVAAGARGTSGPARGDRGPVPTALSHDRVVAWLERSGFSYFADSDGDLGGLWHGRLFYFLVLGERDEVLQVRGQWHRQATIERLEELLEVCNAWNADHICPKTYTRVRDDGGVVVCAETTVDVEHGVTDDQLEQLLQCGLMTGSMFFDSLDAEYPDPLQEAP